jgi:hypothetical protein
MALSHQHRRESQVLHSNYYAATKKTASALKKRVRRGGMLRRQHSALRASMVAPSIAQRRTARPVIVA